MDKTRDQNLFGRLGNKTTDIKYFKDLLPMESKYIIEPFGGTFALSRIVYKDQKYKKFVNDNDPTLWEIYKNPQLYSDLLTKVNNHASKNYDEKKKYIIFKDFLKDIEDDKTIDKNTPMYKYLRYEKFIRGNLYKHCKKINHTIFLEQMKDIKFSNDDYVEVINKFKNKKDAFIFLDPPYLFSDNSQYSKQQTDSDMTDIIVHLLSLFNDKNVKCKLMLVINDLKLLRFLFKDFIKGDYSKVYQLSKKKNKHLIICNY